MFNNRVKSKLGAAWFYAGHPNHLIKRYYGELYLGAKDYFKKPEYKITWGGPFNGQEIRRQIFLSIIARLDINLIIETGTFRGGTTEFMAKNTSCKIITVEANESYYGYSKLRFLLNPQIRIFNNDSRKFLTKVLNKKTVQKKRLFFYLDAHWEEDLPLVEELQIIFQRTQNATIMVDDFQVPDDEGYSFDNYGPGKKLSLELLDELDNEKIFIFFPKQSSELETGFKRGSVVLTNSKETAEKLNSVESLRSYS
ncbi:MAG: hypothetical protein K9J12_15420 [Melioribacteraceae bacterium]|nr:hypothetical protein [Melioribacteraceae bacterium]MCF8263074.1 hypothetical protein [Melioribacteraceae bacterium]MCF8431222.1 hypothetical protein [Melioribacteraceae bacterium]